MNKPIKLQTQGLTFERGAVLYASQLTSLRDKIDEVIEFLPTSFAQTQPTTTEPTTEPTGPSEQDIVNWINDAKKELNDQIEILRGIVAQYDDGHTYVRTDDQMIELFKTPFKSLLVQYGITDSDGNPFFNLFLEKNGITPTMIKAWIDKDSSTSNLGISADYVTIGGQVSLTDKLTAIDAKFDTITVDKEANIKKVVSEMINTQEITVTGDLNYNRLVGNVVTISGNNSVIPSNVAYVKATATGNIRLPRPSDVKEGQTIYVESDGGVILPSEGTALLGGWIYDGMEYFPIGEGSDTIDYYKYRWGLVSYGTTLDKPIYPGGNLSGTILHSYVYTGSGQWVETTSLPYRTMSLTYNEKRKYYGL